jgi:hypothetical protein
VVRRFVSSSTACASRRACLKNDSRQNPGSTARTSGRWRRYGVSVGIATMHALLCAIGVSWAELGAALDQRRRGATEG